MEEGVPEEVAMEEDAREELAVEEGVPEEVAMEEDAREELAVEEGVSEEVAVEEDVPEEVLEDEVPVDVETSSVAGEVASVPEKSDAPDEPLRIEKTQLDFHRYLVEREEIVEEFEEGKLKSRKKTIYCYEL